jgi:hypothetical protein
MARKDSIEFLQMANESGDRLDAMRKVEEGLMETAQDILRQNPNLSPTDVAYCLKEAAKNLVNYS